MKRSGSEYEGGDHRYASKRWSEATRSEMNVTLQQQPPSQLSVQNNPPDIHSQLARLCQENFVGLQGATGVSPISTSFLSTQMNDPVQLIPRNHSSQTVPSNTVVGSALSSNISSASKNLSHMIFSPRSQQLLQNVVRRPELEAASTPSLSLTNQHQHTLAGIVAKLTAENLKRQQQVQQQQINRLQCEIQQIQRSATMSNMFPTSSIATTPLESLLQLQQMQQQQGLLQEYGLSNDGQILDRLLNTSLQQQHQMISVPAAPSRASLQTINIFPEHLNTTSLPLVQVPTNNSIGKMKSKKTSMSDPKILPVSLPVLVVTPETDRMRLSDHQFLLRKNIEFFEADEMDATTHIRGRNKSIQCGQVGIRCIHCAHIPVSRRQKGSTYFPSAKLGIYQAAQNMLTTHIQSGLCNYIPEHVKTQFTCALINKASDSLNQNNGSGRPYWAQAATTLGLVDTENHGIRFVRNIPRDAQVVPDNGTSAANSVR